MEPTTSGSPAKHGASIDVTTIYIYLSIVKIICQGAPKRTMAGLMSPAISVQSGRSKRA
jgi:hypothetical protein